MDIILFLGRGTNKDFFMKKPIYKYLNSIGNIELVSANEELSIKDNLPKIDKSKKYYLIGHSIGSYYVYGFIKYYPKNVNSVIIFDGFLNIYSYIIKEDLLNRNQIIKYYREIKDVKKSNIVFVRNLNKNYDELRKHYTLLEEKRMKNICKEYILIYNKSHNFYMNNSNFNFVKKIIDKYFL